MGSGVLPLEPSPADLPSSGGRNSPLTPPSPNRIQVATCRCADMEAMYVPEDRMASGRSPWVQPVSGSRRRTVPPTAAALDVAGPGEAHTAGPRGPTRHPHRHRPLLAGAARWTSRPTRRRSRRRTATAASSRSSPTGSRAGTERGQRGVARAAPPAVAPPHLPLALHGSTAPSSSRKASEPYSPPRWPPARQRSFPSSSAHPISPEATPLEIDIVHETRPAVCGTPTRIVVQVVLCR